MDEYDLSAYAELIPRPCRNDGAEAAAALLQAGRFPLMAAMAEALPVGSYAAVNSKCIATYDGILPILRDGALRDRRPLPHRRHRAGPGDAVILLPANTQQERGAGHDAGHRASRPRPCGPARDPGGSSGPDAARNGRAGRNPRALDNGCGPAGGLCRISPALHRRRWPRGRTRAAGSRPISRPPTVAPQNAAIYAQVNAGRSHNLIGRLKGTQRQLAPGILSAPSTIARVCAS